MILLLYSSTALRPVWGAYVVRGAAAAAGGDLNADNRISLCPNLHPAKENLASGLASSTKCPRYCYVVLSYPVGLLKLVCHTQSGDRPVQQPCVPRGCLSN